MLEECPAHPALSPPHPKLRDLAVAWREGFFQEIHARFAHGDPAEDIDVTHRRVLDRLLQERGVGLESWNDSLRSRLVQQWHIQRPWADVPSAFELLRQNGNWFLIVLANGTTRLQLDIAQSSGIPFHMLLSSELLGLTKPNPKIYERAMDLVQLPVESCYMLASHLYDLEAAKAAGMTTIYIHRTTEDTGIDIDLKGEHSYVDMYFDGRLEDAGVLAASQALLCGK